MEDRRRIREDDDIELSDSAVRAITRATTVKMTIAGVALLVSQVALTSFYWGHELTALKKDQEAAVKSTNVLERRLEEKTTSLMSLRDGEALRSLLELQIRQNSSNVDALRVALERLTSNFADLRSETRATQQGVQAIEASIIETRDWLRRISTRLNDLNERGVSPAPTSKIPPIPAQGSSG